MSHEILGDLFFQHNRKPAWHDILVDGIEEGRDYTAAEVYAIFGSPRVALAPLQTVGKMQSGQHMAVPYKAILRAPLPADPEPRVFGVVSPDYVLVTPDEIVSLWDEHVKRRVQTMMFLRDGKLMVITAQLDGFSVRGEDVNTYIQIGNWMDGASASTALLSGVCTVCMNTWRMANDAASEQYRFVHDKHIRHRMGQWFEQVVGRATQNLPMMKDAMELLAATKVGTTGDDAAANVKSVLATAYPYPKMPKHDPLAPDEYNLDRLAKWEDLKKTYDMRRATALGMFMGDGTGMSLPTRKGTCWGLYQSVVEVEDFRKGSRGAELASSVLFGERAQAKDRAFNAVLQLAGAQN